MAQPGQIPLSTIVGTEVVSVDNGGAVLTSATTQQIANLGVGGGTTTATLIGTEFIPVQTAAGVPERITTLVAESTTPTTTSFFTTSAQSNSTSVTLSAVFTALTYTQTSTGNTVHLKAAPVNGEIQGFSVTNIVTNLTISSAANTVSAGAQGAAALGQAFWWRFNGGDSTWYKYN